MVDFPDGPPDLKEDWVGNDLAVTASSVDEDPVVTLINRLSANLNRIGAALFEIGEIDEGPQGPPGPQGVQGAQGLQGLTGETGPGLKDFAWTQEGNAVAVTGLFRYLVFRSGTLVRGAATVSTAPTGANLIVVIKKNGVTVLTLTIVAGTTSSGIQTPGSPVTLVSGDILSVDITQVGSSTPGANVWVGGEFEAA
jgi:hypothetical protein